MAECLERLTLYLNANHVHFELEPPQASLAQRPAVERPETDAHRAKAVIARVDERLIMLVLPAREPVDFERVREMLHARSAGAAREAEFQDCFCDCEPGALPLFGHLYEVPVYLDPALLQSSEMTFPAGSRRVSVTLATADYLRLASPTVVEFALRPRALAAG
jgi:Ala-tRNA(Pro) deacylase